VARDGLVTLLTDFGWRDAYAAAMKGVILGLCPRARLVDISHEVPAHDVLAGAFVLAQAAPYFPPDTLHVVVVDPGVGTERPLLAARLGGQTFLAPDNGVISLVAAAMPMEALHVVQNLQSLPRPPAGATFQGRDILAPLAGAILNGLPIRALGPQPATYKLLDIPAPQRRGRQLAGQVLYVDAFGNLVTNISVGALASLGDPGRARVACGGRPVGPLRPAYGFVKPGELLVLINSMGLLEVAVNQGRACDVLIASFGTDVTVALPEA
jgi:S-adenosylmethionine hydrolase